jgi:septum formation inhibitor-activating ATPase MinD
VVFNEKSRAAIAYEDAVSRMLGDALPLRFIQEPKFSLILSRVLGALP